MWLYLCLCFTRDQRVFCVIVYVCVRELHRIAVDRLPGDLLHEIKVGIRRPMGTRRRILAIFAVCIWRTRHLKLTVHLGNTPRQPPIPPFRPTTT